MVVKIDVPPAFVACCEQGQVTPEAVPRGS
jgi:hypothetical protein